MVSGCSLSTTLTGLQIAFMISISAMDQKELLDALRLGRQ